MKGDKKGKRLLEGFHFGGLTKIYLVNLLTSIQKCGIIYTYRKADKALWAMGLHGVVASFAPRKSDGFDCRIVHLTIKALEQSLWYNLLRVLISQEQFGSLV